MFRKLLAVLLIVCLQSLSFAGLLAVLSFKVNKDYIAANICVNRAKPKLNCQGKCYLAKTQKKATEQKDASEYTLKVSYFLVSVMERVSPLFVCSPKIDYNQENNNGRSKGWPRQSFHPPGII
ncbi:MAG TPA: hypothetical protein VGB63_00580 [Pedobacter sp.]|jgi:hypothetical protein